MDHASSDVEDYIQHVLTLVAPSVTEKSPALLARLPVMCNVVIPNVLRSASNHALRVLFQNASPHVPTAHA